MSGDTKGGGDRSLAETVADRLRETLIAGDFAPGQKLSEQQVAAEHGVSRNTQREAVRFLTTQRLLTYVPNRAMVGLCDSPRLSAAFDLVLAELRLAFGQLEESAHLHEPYVALNETLLAAIESGDTDRSVAALEHYLLTSERGVQAALQRKPAR